MARLLVWGSPSLTGHASVQTAEHYLSFHPRDMKLAHDVAGTPAVLKTFDYDISIHQHPTDSVSIDWLDEDRMNQHIDALIDETQSGELQYKLLTTNCSSMAAELLCIGARTPFNPHKPMRELFSEIRRVPFLHDHGRVLELVREAIEDAALICARRGPVGRVARHVLPILLADVASREFIWTPGDVKTFAKGLSTHNHNF
ncbi:MAG: hypothetical protein IDH49_01835 [Gammaproteobacteria bacterium]|nr:hypothetical protein [Gammaproteobacteria bacterium]